MVGTVLRAASALTMACAAGCGVLSAPTAPSGLERQVARGERISAASRASAARQARHVAPTPAPAVAQRKVPGAQVTAVGDSVMAASAMALDSALPGIYIDAVPSRQIRPAWTWSAASRPAAACARWSSWAWARTTSSRPASSMSWCG